jgi:AsmA protein
MWIKVASVVGGVVVLLLAALMIIPRLVPDDVYRERIESAATSALGRPVKLTGKVAVSIFPRLEASAGEATIANPDGFGSAPFASMKELRASVKLIPLLFRKVEIDEFVLVDPNIALVSLPDGRNNWTFIAKTTPQEPAPPPSTPSKPGEQPKPQNFGGALKNVKIVNGRVSFEDRAKGQTQTLAALNLKAQMKAIDQPFRIEADGLANDLPFKITTSIENPRNMIDGVVTPVEIALDTAVLKTSLKGNLAAGDHPNFDLAFSGEIPSAPALADRFKISNLPGRAALGKLSLSGQATGAPGDIMLTIRDARHESPLLNADISGKVRLAEQITVQLTASADAPNLADLASAMQVSAPAASALGRATATMKVSGEAGDLTFSDVAFKHEGDLQIAFDGSARMSKAITYKGHVALVVANLRGLAQKAGVTLPPGDVYKRFTFSGDTTGDTSSVMLSNASVDFDAIHGEGKAGLTFSGKPKLTGQLSTNLIDVSSYAMAAGAPPAKDPPPPSNGPPQTTGPSTGPAAPGTGPWGNTPIDLAPLKAVDADLKLEASGVKYQKFAFGASQIDVTLRDGRMVADLNKTSLYGGTGTAKLVADATSKTPQVTLDAKFAGVQAKPLLVAAAAFQAVDGKGDFNIHVDGAGATLQTMMSSYAGAGQFNFTSGAIQGFDLAKFADLRKDQLNAQALLHLASSLGPSAKTTFDAMNATFAIKDGLAATNNLRIRSAGFDVASAAWLDIGGQRAGLNMLPQFKNGGQGVNGFGLPLKVSGTWTGQMKYEPDYDYLVQRLIPLGKPGTGAEADSWLRSQLGSRYAGVLAGAPAQSPVSGSNAPPLPGVTPAPAPTDAKSAEDLLKEKAKEKAAKALGDLFKKNK